MFKYLNHLAAMLLLLITVSLPAYADQAKVDDAKPSSATSKQLPALPEPLTRQAIREVLSGLDDTQVRDLLVNELDQKVAAQEALLAARSQRSFGDTVTELASALAGSLARAFLNVPDIPRAAGTTYERYLQMRGDESTWSAIVKILLCVLAGAGAAILVNRFMTGQQARMAALRPSTLWSQIGICILRLLVQSLDLITFVITAHIINAIFNGSVAADNLVANFVIGVIGWTWFAVIMTRFVLSPKRPDLRLCSIDDEAAQFLTTRLAVIFGWSAFSIGILTLLRDFGWPFTLVRVGFWFSIVLYGFIILTIWQARHDLTQLIVGHRGSGPLWNRFARTWPLIAIGLVGLLWLTVELVVATGNLRRLSMTAMIVSLVVVIALPLFELILRSLVEAIWPIDPDQDVALQAAHVQTQAGLVRCGRIILAIVLVIGLAKLWGVNLQDLATKGVGVRFAGELLELSLIAVIAYGLWELLNVVADRQTAIERVTLGLESEAEQERVEGGGKAGTRLGTLMPLFRVTGKVAIAVLAVLAALGQLGVNVAPLLAGAGIFGLAIGFGAQTLVKDVISGVFFLIDDAFRKGEYIDIGDVKGTVEKISIRSMQLRHHNGPLNTVPFGEIRHLTNYSRDWVIMKLSLRVTYDTDVETLRKLIKRLGLQLMEDPELGPKFLEPLKSQGVIEMDDSAMIVRVKFMTRPGDQFGIRNKVYTQIREMFEREGIKFAHREVTVHVADRDVPLSDAEREAAAAAARRAIDQEDAKAHR